MSALSPFLAFSELKDKQQQLSLTTLSHLETWLLSINTTVTGSSLLIHIVIKLPEWRKCSLSYSFSLKCSQNQSRMWNILTVHTRCPPHPQQTHHTVSVCLRFPQTAACACTCNAFAARMSGGHVALHPPRLTTPAPTASGVAVAAIHYANDVSLMRRRQAQPQCLPLQTVWNWLQGPAKACCYI